MRAEDTTQRSSGPLRSHHWFYHGIFIVYNHILVPTELQIGTYNCLSMTREAGRMALPRARPLTSTVDASRSQRQRGQLNFTWHVEALIEEEPRAPSLGIRSLVLSYSPPGLFRQIISLAFTLQKQPRNQSRRPCLFACSIMTSFVLNFYSYRYTLHWRCAFAYVARSFPETPGKYPEFTAESFVGNQKE